MTLADRGEIPGPSATSRCGPSARVGDPHAGGRAGCATASRATLSEVGEAERYVREVSGGARAHGGGRAPRTTARSWRTAGARGRWVARRAKAMLEAERG